MTGVGDPARPGGYFYAGIRQHIFAKPGSLGSVDSDQPDHPVEDLAIAVSDALSIGLTDARAQVVDAIGGRWLLEDERCGR